MKSVRVFFALLNMYLLWSPRHEYPSAPVPSCSYINGHMRGTSRPDDIHTVCAKASPKSPNQPSLQPLNPPLDSKRHLYLA